MSGSVRTLALTLALCIAVWAALWWRADDGFEASMDAFDAQLAATPVRTMTPEKKASVLVSLDTLASDASATTDPSARNLRLASVLCRRGRFHYLEGRSDLARSRLQEALALDPASPLAHEILGIVRMQAGDNREALAHLEKAGRTPIVLLAKTRALIGQGDLEGARARAKEALALAADPEWVQGLHILAEIELRSGNPSQAKEIFERCLASPDRPQGSFIAVAILFHETEHRDVALDYLRRGIAAGDDPRVSMQLLAGLHLSHAEFVSARPFLERLAVLLPTDPEVLGFLGLAQASTGDPASASQTTERAWELWSARNPDIKNLSAEARRVGDVVRLAWARAAHGQGDLKPAEIIYKEIIEGAAEWTPLVRSFLADIYERTGRFPLAAAELKRAWWLKALRPDDHGQLGWLFYKAGDLEAARIHLAKKLSLGGILVPREAEASRELERRAATQGPSARASEHTTPAGPLYADEAQARGLSFDHTLEGPRLYPFHSIPPGTALADLDGDGHLDCVLLDSGGPWENPRPMVAVFRAVPGGRFERVDPASIGITLREFAMGVTACDVEGDGHVDLAIATLHGVHIARNMGDGTFRPLDGASPLISGWASHAAFGDYDRDGVLDVYVTRYSVLDRGLATRPPTKLHNFRGVILVPETMEPSYFKPGSGSLFRGRADGTYQDVTQEMGVANPDRWAMTVLFTDLDADGWPDLYIANDVSANRLYKNGGRGRPFEDVSRESGAEDPRGSMGLAILDLDGTGGPSIYVTNFRDGENGLLVKRRGLVYDDSALTRGVAKRDTSDVGWGCVFTDAENDGDFDLVVVNGSPFAQRYDPARITTTEDPFEPQAIDFYENQGRGVFREASTRALGDLERRSYRGLAAGDIDSDGGEDLLVTASGGAARLLHNVGARRGHWLEVALAGVQSNRAAVGARVRVRRGDRWLVRQVLAGDSYQSSSSPVLHFGLGPTAEAAEVIVEWPSGRRSALLGVAGDRVVRLVEPTGG